MMQHPHDTVMAAGPTGKGQKTLLDALKQQGGTASLTELISQPQFRGMHFGALMKAAEVLDRKGLVTYDAENDRIVLASLQVLSARRAIIATLLRARRIDLANAVAKSKGR
jgi:hypothetical protein